jgi:hypothetical protein
MSPARVAPGPAHPEPRVCVFLAPRFRGAAARTSRIRLTELSLYPLSNAHLRFRLVARDADELEIAGNPHGLAHVAEYPTHLCPREGGALVVPVARSAAREGAALRAENRRRRSRMRHVARDDCDDYEYPYDGDANGGGGGERGGGSGTKSRWTSASSTMGDGARSARPHTYLLALALALFGQSKPE